MSHVGRLPKVLDKISCVSEAEALRVLRERSAIGLKAHYIRHKRDSFTVVVMEAGHE